MNTNNLQHEVRHEVRHEDTTTLTGKIMWALAQSAVPLDYQETYAAVRTLFPNSVVSISSLQSILSTLYRRGDVEGVVSAESGRLLYRVAVQSDMTHAAVPSAPAAAQSVAPTSSATNGRDHEFELSAPPSERTQRGIHFNVSMSVAPQTLSAVTELVAFLRLGNNLFAQSGMMQNVASAFVHDQPYRDPRFFATKFRSRKVNGVMVRFSVKSEKTIRRLKGLLAHSDLARRGIVTDGRPASDTALNKAIINHTALMWYLITRLTERQQELPGVVKFIEYAERNYRSKEGLGIVTVYRAIAADITAGKTAGLKDGASAPANAQPTARPETPAQDRAEDDFSIHGPRGPVPGVLQAQTATKPSADSESAGDQEPVARHEVHGFEMKADGAGGLFFSVHLSPEIVSGLLYKIMQALDVITRQS